MWPTLIFMVVLLANVARFGASEEKLTSSSTEKMMTKERITTQTAPSSTGAEGNTAQGANKRCESPASLLSDQEIQSTVLTKLRQMRAEADERSCKFNDLTWNSTLEKTAKDFAMKCPLVNNTRFEGSEEFGRIVSITYGNTKKLEDMIRDLRQPSYNDTKVINIYRNGIWDPSYQIVWNQTRSVGCSFVSFTHSDPDYLRDYFKTDVKGPTTVTALVCDFFPAGCLPGLRVYNICPKEEAILTDWPPTRSSIRRETRIPREPEPWTKKSRHHHTWTGFSEGSATIPAFNVAVLCLCFSIYVREN